MIVKETIWILQALYQINQHDSVVAVKVDPFRNKVGLSPAPPPATFGGDLMVPSRMAMHMTVQQQADVRKMDEGVAAQIMWINKVMILPMKLNRVNNRNNVENDDIGNNQDVNGNEYSENDNTSGVDENNRNNVKERIHNRNKSLISGDNRGIMV